MQISAHPLIRLASSSIETAGGSCRDFIDGGVKCGEVGKAVGREYDASVGLHKAGDADGATLFYAVKGGMRVAQAQKFFQVKRTFADVYEREARIGLCYFFDLGAVGTSRHNVDFHRG